MPIKISDKLPAKKTLESENIFVMTEHRAAHQDIRPIRILILNLMPTKITTETQLLRLLGNTPLHVEIELLQMVSHNHKNTSKEHLLAFYKSFKDVKNEKFDGMIITGAPVEFLDYAEVDYWDELCEIMEWSKHNVYSTMHICWGAQAGLFYHYGVPKYTLKNKLPGVFKNKTLITTHPLLRGFDDEFYVPQSRNTEIRREDIEKIPELDILAESEKAGIHIVADHSCRKFFVTGHFEYDRDTLKTEYERDVAKGVEPSIPENYFENNQTDSIPPMKWRAHAGLVFSNWINFIVYEHTPYNLNELN